MAAKRSEVGEQRTRARSQALQMLFAEEFSVSGKDTAGAIAEVMDDVVPETYAYEICTGVREHREQIDRAIEVASENWTLSRMPSTDRAILRIAVFELLFRDDIPAGVSINEAVELAQHFGGEDDSYRFVNGVLGNVAAKVGDAGQLQAEPVDDGAEDA